MVNIILITAYSFVCLISETLLFLIVKFIREKPLEKQRFLDYVQIDVALCKGLYIGFHSSMSVLREIVGPFSSEALVESLMFFVLWLFYGMNMCILSLQFVQFFCIFYSATLHEWGDSALILGHRMFVFFGSLSASGIVCLNRGGTCWKGPLFMYILQDTIKSVPFKASFATMFPTIGFFVTTIVLQATIEVRRFMVQRAENEAEIVSWTAQRQIEEAFRRLKTQTLPNILPIQSRHEVRTAWAEPKMATLEPPHTAETKLALSNSIEIRRAKNNNLVRSKAINIARYVFVLGSLGSFVTILINILGNVNILRPHGSFLSLFFTFGIIIPSMLICGNQKLRHFTLELIKNTFNYS